MANVGKTTSNEPDHGWTLFIISVVMVIASGFLVIARLATRLSKRIMGLDDYLIIAAMISLILLSLTTCLGTISPVVNGLGKRMADLSMNETMQAFKWFYGAQIVYVASIMLYKESMLFLFLRIFPGNYFRWTCFVMVGLVTAAQSVILLLTVFQCTPVAAFWDKSLLKTPGNHCIQNQAFWLSNSIINVLLDFSIFVLPIYKFLKLQLHNREKIALICVFSVGIFVCATTIVRTTTLAASADSTDPTWAVIPATIWSVVEAHTGTICACLPTLKKPLSVFFPSSHKSSGLGPTCPENCLAGYPIRLDDHPHSDDNAKSKVSSANRSRNRDSSAGTGAVEDYHRWGLAHDGKGEMGATVHGNSRGSEDRERLTGDAVKQGTRIMRTMDVDVNVSVGSSSGGGLDDFMKVRKEADGAL